MSDQKQQNYSISQRLYRSLGPVAAGLFLDLVDLATFGPIGLVLGGIVAWCLASLYRFSTQGKVLLAVLGAAYCMIPTTNFFPLAMIIAAACRFFERPPGPPQKQKQSKQPPQKHVDSKVK